MNVQRRVTETTEFGERLSVRGVVIGGKEYTLHIGNVGERLSLVFSKPNVDTEEFTISIWDGKVRFHRTRWRPDHDHDDQESLQIIDGRPVWFSRFPYQGEGRSFFEIGFGSVTE